MADEREGSWWNKNSSKVLEMFDFEQQSPSSEIDVDEFSFQGSPPSESPRCPGAVSVSTSRKKRKRVKARFKRLATERREANARERERVRAIGVGFQELEACLPAERLDLSRQLGIDMSGLESSDQASPSQQLSEKDSSSDRENLDVDFVDMAGDGSGRFQEDEQGGEASSRSISVDGQPMTSLTAKDSDQGSRTASELKASMSERRKGSRKSAINRSQVANNPRRSTRHTRHTGTCSTSPPQHTPERRYQTEITPTSSSPASLSLLTSLNSPPSSCHSSNCMDDFSSAAGSSTAEDLFLECADILEESSFTRACAGELRNFSSDDPVLDAMFYHLENFDDVFPLEHTDLADCISPLMVTENYSSDWLGAHAHACWPALELSCQTPC